MSTGLGHALDPTLICVDSKEIMSILYIEHELEYRESTIERLISMGCKVEPINFPGEAIDKLLENKYQMIIFDLKFPNPHIQGDRFIEMNYSLTHGAKLVALTGEGKLLDDEIRQRLKIEVVVKASEEDRLFEISKQVYKDVQQKAKKKT